MPVPAGPTPKHQLAWQARRLQVLGLGRGLGDDLAAHGAEAPASAGQVAGAAWPMATRTSALADLGAWSARLGDGLTACLALARALASPRGDTPPPGRFDQHPEGVLDQGGVTAVRAGHGADGRRRTGA